MRRSYIQIKWNKQYCVIKGNTCTFDVEIGGSGSEAAGKYAYFSNEDDVSTTPDLRDLSSFSLASM